RARAARLRPRERQDRPRRPRGRSPRRQGHPRVLPRPRPGRRAQLPPGQALPPPQALVVLMPLVQLESLTLAFAGIRGLDGVSLSVDAGALFAVIRPNGAGKTSLFNCISGVYRASAGRVVLDGRDLTPLSPHRIAALDIARMFQNPALFEAMTVLDNLLV